jgi:hypothetical protein
MYPPHQSAVAELVTIEVLEGGVDALQKHLIEVHIPIYGAIGLGVVQDADIVAVFIFDPFNMSDQVPISSL